jgi:predicted RNase H-like HicB family nuclease
LTTAATAPGLFTQNASGGGSGAILNQDNTLNGPGNGAAKGSIVQVFLTGEGQTNPPSVTGAITTATLPPPQVTPAPPLPIQARINGQPALYSYAGEAPGQVAGVMQLNVQIPANAPSGNLSITVSIGGNISQNGVTVSVQREGHARVGVMKYPVALVPTEEGYSVSCPGLPGCWSQGATEEEALANIQDAISEYLALAKELAGRQNLREVEIPA